jgi:hypothetical protein
MAKMLSSIVTAFAFTALVTATTDASFAETFTCPAGYHPVATEGASSTTNPKEKCIKDVLPPTLGSPVPRCPQGQYYSYVRGICISP